MKIFRHIFVVLLLLFISTTATAQSQSDNTQTKAVSTTKADVNGDGVVNEADIEEIIAIMQQENGTKYYWYAGWTEPSADPSSDNYIGKIINEADGKAGQYIGTQLGTYDKVDYLAMIRYSDSSKYDYYYVVVPEGIKLYDSEGDALLEDQYSVTSIVIPGHRVLKSKKQGFAIGAIMLR